ncbi:iron uptake protein [Stenotrophomonas sp. SY1]|uniref:iron uptake protein n=1 Tax=Stenotrophomonas sp. SY1 TaxID=477235 RepID=UPI001E480D86|nr:iron uptake protein [Stenotrophomonas sp. SY1]MCD9085472.1 iron uptake protein [Stenotrophomonas sp. SY1]
MSQPSTTIASSGASRLHVIARVLAAVFAGYGFAWAAVAASTSLLTAAGLKFHDAEFLGAMIGVLTYVAVFLWAIAARRLGVVWAVLLVGGALLAGVGSIVQSLLL